MYKDHVYCESSAINTASKFKYSCHALMYLRMTCRLHNFYSLPLFLFCHQSHALWLGVILPSMLLCQFVKI